MTAQTGKLSIDPLFPIMPGGDITKVIVIGCGGTGSFFIRDLARLVGSMKVKPEIILIDGDKVEEKNLIRQNFVSADIGRNKAEVQVGRYTSLSGAKMAFVDKYLSDEKQLGEIGKNNFERAVVVSCVDNVKTRMLIRNSLKALCGNINQMFWIDCGNEEETGQVVCSSLVPDAAWKNDINGYIRIGRYPTPDVFDLYPELIERANLDKLPTEMNCAEMAASSPQFGFVNGTAAMLAVNFVHRLLSRGSISVYESCFSIDNKFSHRNLTVSTLKGWKDFEPFKSVSLETLKK